MNKDDFFKSTSLSTWQKSTQKEKGDFQTFFNKQCKFLFVFFPFYVFAELEMDSENVDSSSSRKKLLCLILF